ncbi:hypothetical protein K2224_38930 (plasmid) [Streptomyces sp. BHT-5-2]|nr:hypothetical protein [Streptomyces sp. BHT-5-2]QZL08964.1 hypothetical protein K2224_38930 [Streptomyces sp. BHT-5-2]
MAWDLGASAARSSFVRPARRLARPEKIHGGAQLITAGRHRYLRRIHH